MRDRNYWLGLISLLLLVSGIYFKSQAYTIYGGDAGDMASAIIVGGIPHPPGYPLYTLLGIIISKIITFGSIAWKIGFLSSIPAVFTIIILYDLIYYLTKKVSIALLTGFSIAFIYPLWLYAEVVEVFSLNNLFLIGLIWLLVHWSFTHKTKYLYAASFVFGLSVSHHHIILFLTPCLIYLLFRQRKNLTIRLAFKLSGLFLLGLAPYLYILIASFYNSSPVNWMGSFSVENFIYLVTRARYGTFQSSGFITHDPFLRLLSVWAFIDFAFKDFRLAGAVFVLLGFFYLFKNHKILFKAFFAGILSYLFFLFYAAFPIVDNFMVATYERFLLPLYMLLAPLIAFGILTLKLFLSRLLSHIVKNARRNFVSNLISVCFFIYPLGLFMLNYPRISILKNDFSAESLGRDILSSVASQSILILSTDTPLFDTQYVYYAQKYRNDVKIIHLTDLYIKDALKRLRGTYPDLEVPEPKEDTSGLLDDFLEKNYNKFPIYSKLSLQTQKGTWIPYGLVFRFLKKGDVMPPDESILAENERLWSLYQNPLNSSLAKYQNLMLSDILPIYSTAHQEIGFWAVKRKYSATGEEHLRQAEKIYPNDLDSYIILAQSYIVDKRCTDAQRQIDEVAKRSRDDPRIYFLQSINYAVCFKDREKAIFYQKAYEEKKREKEVPLKKL